MPNPLAGIGGNTLEEWLGFQLAELIGCENALDPAECAAVEAYLRRMYHLQNWRRAPTGFQWYPRRTTGFLLTAVKAARTPTAIIVTP